LLVNRRFEELFRVERQTILGKTDQLLFAPEFADVFQVNDQQAIAAGQLPDMAPVVTSNANPHYQKHFDRLFALAKADDWDGVGNYEVKGSNSYSKMVARYRQDLLAVHAASEPAQ